MRQIVNTGDGGYDVLEIQNVPDPEPKQGELLIEVRASGLNFADIMARRGTYMDAPPKPCVMGYEVAGIVESTGPGVDEEWIGKEVLAMCRFKGQAEKVVVTPYQIFEKPSSLSFVEAAALPVNYLTAWVLIEVMGALKTSESILIHNAGGGVGLAALQVARHIGAKTYGTASPRKHDFLLEQGLDHPIDYRNNDWYEQLMKVTDDRGVELIIDPLGGKEWKRSYKALRSSGRLGMFGVTTPGDGQSGGLMSKLKLLSLVFKMPLFHPISIVNNNKGVFGVNLGHMWHEKEKARLWMNQLLEGVKEGWLSPHVDATFRFEEVPDAHRYIEERRNIGKVILVP